MHKGKTYPYLHEYWAGNTQFWPNYCPRKIALARIDAAVGGSWDLLPHIVPPNISGVGVFDVATGVTFWSYVHPLFFYAWVFSLYSNANDGSPPRMNFILTLPLSGGSGECDSTAIFNFSFLEPTDHFVVGTVSPPFSSLTPSIDLSIRGATWAEV